ncbi:MAG: two-component sensor histidine kinase [Ignavibacteria bacterium CG_4_10_14_3_um_filter_37_18]|nr:two-component sensor histidine kinase [Ignavibacteria bacterium]PIX93563.1 MAG: two-component sensor histidine kinase [Ignavibacteria bacterium CG_4_10_14_3_um_filter_37_18]PJC57960.1 MAG: two-component sensor histidine kinase [Ignavibacteria bacterium CG_4_9_14_0_2_um_filter_37_13]
MLRKLANRFSFLLLFKIEIFIFLILFIAPIFFTSMSLQRKLIFAIWFVGGLLILAFFFKRRLKVIFSVIEKRISKMSQDDYADDGALRLSYSFDEIESALDQMAEKFKSDIAKMKRLERIRTEFLGNVSHELRTPIFTIQGFLETLLNGALEDPKVNRKFLEKAAAHTENLNNLLNDLIDISMIESGEMRLSFRYFNLMDFLVEVVKEFDPILAKKNLQIEINQSNKKLEVFGDKNKLRQVFVNLIQNAIKYSNSGKIQLIVDEEKNSALIIVKDFGLGIPGKDIERIFERFYRVDKTRSKDIGGTGLGLAIVKHIVEAHQSRIEVKSIVGEGSEFSFRLKK